MRETEIFPYYFPTTVMFVDDNLSFLQSLALQLPEQLAYRMLERPEQALALINAPPRMPPLYERCFSHHRDGDIDQASERLIHLDLSLIEREVSNADRFEEISVVIADYDMPAMDGLELCRRIENPRIKKILFTGVADEKIAVRAFNDGIIDRFIIKSEADASDMVNAAIQTMQHRYFEDISRTLRSTLMLDAPPFLNDRAFGALFARLREENSFVEYYLVANPGGCLLLTDRGALHRLVVLSERDLDLQAEWARTAGAPTEVVDALHKRRKVGYFYDVIDPHLEPETYDWDEYLHEATHLRGTEDWYWALIADPPVDIDFDEDHSNYHAYLERLDAEAAA